MCVSRWYDHLAEIPPGRLECEMVGNFKRGREESRGENCLDGFGGLRRGAKRSRQSSARRRKRQQTQRDHRHNAEHSFRTYKEADQIKPSLVFVNAATGPQ